MSRVARGYRLSLPALLLALTQCAPGAGSPAAVPASAPQKASGTGMPAQLSELSTRERELEKELRRTVQELAVAIGERNPDKKWELAEASDYLAIQLEEAGYAVERQGYELGEIIAQNLEVTIPGRLRGTEVVLVGAHYDSAPGSPGANDNATGAAAVLALARAFSGSEPKRTLRFVQFASSEAPYARTPDMGAAIYAKRARGNGDQIVAMLSLDALGYYSDRADTQREPRSLSAGYPKIANFIAVVGDESSRVLTQQVKSSLSRSSSLPVQSAVLPADTADAGWSDNWAFWQLGFSAVMVTDTGRLRYPHHHGALDTPDKLDFERMARVVAALEGAVAELAQVSPAGGAGGT